MAIRLKDEDITFNIYGNGKERRSLEDIVVKEKLNNVQFKGSVAKTRVPEILNKANLLFVSTAKVLYGSENKLYEYMAIGKPIIVATESAHNNPIKDIKCGIELNRDNVVQASSDLINFIKENKNQFKYIGRNGQEYVKANRKMSLLGNEFENFCNEIIGNV